MQLHFHLIGQNCHLLMMTKPGSWVFLLERACRHLRTVLIRWLSCQWGWFSQGGKTLASLSVNYVEACIFSHYTFTLYDFGNILNEFCLCTPPPITRLSFATTVGIWPPHSAPYLSTLLRNQMEAKFRNIHYETMDRWEWVQIETLSYGCPW